MRDTRRSQIDILQGRLVSLERRAGETREKPTVVAGCIRELRNAIEQLEIVVSAAENAQEELRLAQQQIESERQRYRCLLELLPDPYVVTDLGGTILDVNPAAARLFNLSQRFLLGRGLQMFLARERTEFLAFISRLSASSEILERPLRVRPREQHWRDVVATVSVLTDVSGVAVELQWLFRPAVENEPTFDHGSLEPNLEMRG